MFGKLLDRVGRVQTIFTLLGVTGLGAMSVYLACTTLILRLFAPWSYFVAGCLGVLLALLICHFALGVFISATGWKPEPRSPRRPVIMPDAKLEDVVIYLRTQSGLSSKIAKASDADAWRTIDDEIMEKVGHLEMHIWGKSDPDFPPYRIPFHQWRYCSVSSQKRHVVRQPSELGSKKTDFFDVKLNWGEVKKAWPPQPLFARAWTSYRTLQGSA